jgi:pyrimidine 5'-nucleotidase
MVSQCVEHIFFDCDDTLYSNSWATMSKLNAKFGAYCSDHFGLPESKMMDLYKTHGTTLCGLVREGYIEEAQVPEFLSQVHDITLDEDIKPDPDLRSMLLEIPYKRWVFTAATREHAVRCLRRLGIEDCFEGIIACSSTEVFEKAGYVSKHDRRCFEFAMDTAGVPRDQVSKCMLLDDSASNLKSAKGMGWTTVLVGLYARNGSKVDTQNADVSVSAIHEIRQAVPSLFLPSPSTTAQKTTQLTKAHFYIGKEANIDCKGDVSSEPKGKVSPPTSLKRRKDKVVKPSLSSPQRRVLRRVSTPLSPRSKIESKKETTVAKGQKQMAVNP